MGSSAGVYTGVNLVHYKSTFYWEVLLYELIVKVASNQKYQQNIIQNCLLLGKSI